MDRVRQVGDVLTSEKVQMLAQDARNPWPIGEKPVVGAADISAAIDEATKASKNSVLLLVSKGGKQAEMRFIALKLKK